MGAFLASLRAAVLRVAVAAGGADAGLNETSVATLFNLSGSSFDRQARYDGASLTLPSRLPWPKAKALVRVMLDSIAASLVVAEGSLLHRMLLQLPFVPLDEQAQAAVAKLIAVVESEMSSRLQRGGGADASSSSSSTWSAQPPQPPQPPALPMPFAPQPQPQLLPPAPQPQLLPPAPPAPPPALPPLLDVSMSLQSNARRLVQARLGRSMTQPVGCRNGVCLCYVCVCLCLYCNFLHRFYCNVLLLHWRTCICACRGCRCPRACRLSQTAL